MMVTRLARIAHSRNKEVNIASGSTASIIVSTASANIGVASISQDTACAYIASQSSGKKISIQVTDVVGFDKSKVKCFNCHKMGHFARECMAPKSQDRGRRDNYRQGSKVEEQAPKALMAIDGVGWDWSYMANDDENHALVADEEAPSEFALKAKTSAESEVFDNSLCSKAWLAQVEDRPAEHRNQELKYCEKIRVFEFKTESRENCIESLTKDLELLKKEKSVVSPPPAQVYSPPKKDMSWTGLPEFKDDTVTDYSRPAPTVKSSPDDAQNRNSSVIATEASPSTITPKPFIKFVKATDSKPSKSSNVRGNQRNWNNLESHQLGGCKITGKGTIKIGKLEFKNVYFVKDLKDFKLLDNANMLLRTPRQHNIYSIDLNNIVPHKDLTCLVAKASADEGIKREFSNARTPQQNGVAARRNRTLIEAAKTMLANAKLPVTFWAEAVNTACYVQNRVLVNKSQTRLHMSYSMVEPLL
nr:putative ribonuclease H-like domain-containing protein [Tanacetum cinerariifolium]